MTVKEFAAGSAKALLTTTKVLFRILVGLISACFSIVVLAFAHAPRDEEPGYGARRSDDGLTMGEREELARVEGHNVW